MANTTRERASRGTGGFTLFELLLVLAIIGALVGIVAPSLDVGRFRVDSAILEVQTAIAGAKSQAVLRGHDIRLTFDTTNNFLGVLGDTDSDGVQDIGESYRIVELPEGVVFGRADADARPLGGSAVTMTKKVDDLPLLTFHRNGSASEESVIYLTSGGEQAIHARAIEISRATGRVECYSFKDGTSWNVGC